MRRRVGIYVLVDGLGYELVRRTDVLPEFELCIGFRSEFGPAEVMHATFVTGAAPEDHGVLAPVERANGHGAFDAARPWAVLPSWIADSSWVREWVRRRTVASLGEGAELPRCPLRLLVHFDRPHPAVGFGALDRGDLAVDFARWQRDGLRLRWHVDPRSDETQLAAAHSSLSQDGSDFVVVRLRELADLLRRHGSEHPEVTTHLDRLTRGLRDLQSAAESMVEEVEFFVFGDRAMVDVHGSVDVARVVEQEFGRNGDRVLAFYDETQAWFWAKDPDDLVALGRLLSREAHGRLVHEDELRRHGWPALRDLDRALYVLDPGLTIASNFVRAGRPAAAAGYHPELPETYPALLGNFSPSIDVGDARSLHRLLRATVERIFQDAV